MYKLWKCFNTTLKFLNKSWISQLLLELEVGLSWGWKPNKSEESPAVHMTMTTANPPPPSSHQNFFIGRNQSFCWTISNHFNLYDCRFFGCKAASWYSGSNVAGELNWNIDNISLQSPGLRDQNYSNSESQNVFDWIPYCKEISWNTKQEDNILNKSQNVTFYLSFYTH